MAFDIEFTDEWVPESELGNAARYGQITLDDHTESFLSTIGFWSPHDYEMQWTQAVRRIVEERRESCLITSLHDPAIAEILMWWLLYPQGKTVAIQNAILVLDDLTSPFSTATPWVAIPKWHSHTEDGDAISEWRVDIASFREFLGC